MAYSDPGPALASQQDSGGFSIQKILSSLSSSGVASTGHFEVQITGKDGTMLEKDLIYRAESVSIPGRTVMSIEHKFTNYGPLNKVPYGQVYTDVTVSFLLSEDLREKAYFEMWHEKMVSTGCMGGEQRPLTFNAKYFDDYTGVVLIRQYGTAGDLRSVHRLHEAYPLMMSDVQMNWGEDNPAKISITFAYRYYDAIFNNQQQPGLGANIGLSIGRNTGANMNLGGILTGSAQSGLGAIGNLNLSRLFNRIR